MNRDVNIYDVNTYKPHSFYNVKNKNFDNAVSLDGSWNFVFTNDEKVNIIEIDYNNANKINVPSNIEFNGYGQKQYVNTQYPWEGRETLVPPEVPMENSIGLYQKNVILPDEWENNRLFISFQGVENAFELFINNKFVGYSEDSHTPSEFEITEFYSARKLDIRVKVYKYSTSSWLEDQDFWRIFGIHRSVNITAREQNFVEDIKTYQNFIEFPNLINFDVVTKQEVPEQLKIQLVDRLGNNSLINGKVLNPILWNVDEPYLYTLIIETKNEILSLDIGLRKIEIIDSIIYINEKRIFLKGINRHDFSRLNGRAVAKEELEWDVRFIKEHNFNAIRTSHYPNDSYFYELCNKYGIFVINEVNLETHGTWQNPGGVAYDKNTLPNDNVQYRDAVLKRAENLLSRDFNHPSVISWSLGNESYGGKTLYEMSEFFKENDKSRFVHYEGITWDRRYNDTSDVESRMYPKMEEIIDYLENDNSKPYILCEFSHAMGNSNGNIHKYYELGRKYDSFQGAFIWEMFEHSLLNEGKEVWGGDFYDRPTDYFFVIDGIVDGGRKTTDKAEYIKYAQQPILFKYKNNTLTISNEYDYKDINDYRVIIKEFNNIIYDKKISIANGKSMEIKIMSNNFNIEVLDLNNPCNLDSNVVARKSYVNNYVSQVGLIDETPLNIINSNVNIGIRGKNFHHMFNKMNATFASIKFNDKEFVYKTGDSLKPNFWRVPTNNDLGAFKHVDLAIWKTVSYYEKIEFLEVIEDRNNVIIKTKIKNIEIYIDYKIDNNGKINVRQYSKKLEEMPDLFCFGMRLPFNKEFSNVTYVGNGPEESYIDRCENMLFNKYKINVEQQNRYLVPQEYGNRTNVYELQVNGYNNHKLLIKSKTPFEFSFKSETDSMLEGMTHFGYSKTNANELKIHSKMTGVAGDDSWGAWAWDEYTVKSNEEHVLEFSIEGE